MGFRADLQFKFVKYLVFFQENCNKLVSDEYTEETKRAMAMLNEKELSFELIEVSVDHLAVFHSLTGKAVRSD